MSIDRREKRRLYLREYSKKWRKANPDKEKASKERYYLKQAKKILSRNTNPDNNE
ncbi:MAG: phosphatase [Clostridia bacterium]|nr:phosphatase [Clostridia bacterium]